jgi:hypothetical protein
MRTFIRYLCGVILAATMLLGMTGQLTKWMKPAPVQKTDVQIALDELYQLTPEDWNDQAYRVYIVPGDADSCGSYQNPVCYTII